MRNTLTAGLALALIAGPAAAGTFHDVGVPSGQLTAITNNGRIAAGIAGDSAWRWNKDRGAVPLTGFVSSNGMSPWAQPVAGAWTDGNGDNVAALAYSNSDLIGGPVEIGGYPGTGGGFDGNVSEAYGVSADGIAVGLAYDETNNPIAFRWTETDGMTRLAVNRPDTYSRANGISDDGSLIYGWNDQDTGYRSGVIWQDGVPLDLVDADGNPVGEALAANADGSVVVGSDYETANGSEAWRWTAATGVQPIGVISRAPAAQDIPRLPAPPAASERIDTRIDVAPNGFFPPAAYGFAVSDDGDVVVGSSGIFPNRYATIWTPAGGMEFLSDYAAAHGVTIPDGWVLNTADAVSADGKVVGGWGFGPAGIASFVIDLHDSVPAEAMLEAHGTVNWNDLPSGPFAGVPLGTEVTMSFRMPTTGFEIEPGEDTSYPLELDTFSLDADGGSDTLIETASGPSMHISNDYPKSDGIHLFETPMATSGQTMEFELFNPGGDMFDSDDLDRINRTFGPEFFEKISWYVGQQGGAFGMYMTLESVSIHDVETTPTTYAIGGTVSGLEGSGLVLQQNGGDDLAIDANGAFAFATPVADGSAYSVTVSQQPADPGQTCTVENGDGTIAGGDIDDVSVVCGPLDPIFASGFDD